MKSLNSILRAVAIAAPLSATGVLAQEAQDISAEAPVKTYRVIIQADGLNTINEAVNDRDACLTTFQEIAKTNALVTGGFTSMKMSCVEDATKIVATSACKADVATTSEVFRIVCELTTNRALSKNAPTLVWKDPVSDFVPPL